MAHLGRVTVICVFAVAAVLATAATGVAPAHARPLVVAQPVPEVELAKIEAAYGTNAFVPGFVPDGYQFTGWEIAAGSPTYLADTLLITFGRSGDLLQWTVSDGRRTSMFSNCPTPDFYDTRKTIDGQTIYYARGNHGNEAWTCKKLGPEDFERVAITLWVENAEGRPSPDEAMRIVASAGRLGAPDTSVPAPPTPNRSVSPKAKERVIKSDRSLAGWKIGSDPTLGAAVGYFGEPTTLRRRGVTCRLNWKPFGLTMWFINLGGQNACSPVYGRLDAASAKGKEWRTAKGLRIGQSWRAIKRTHRTASYRTVPNRKRPNGPWWLVTRPYAVSYSVGLVAIVKRGKVNEFVVIVQAGGI